jgi:hypothetical protein
MQLQRFASFFGKVEFQVLERAVNRLALDGRFLIRVGLVERRLLTEQRTRDHG